MYGASVTGMLAVSGTYHLRRLWHRERRLLRRVDHTMILVATAGTYTAVIVLALDGTTRVVLLVVAWALVLVGAAIRMLWLDAPSGLVALVYVVAGWQMLLDVPAYVGALSTPPSSSCWRSAGRATASAPGSTRCSRPEPVAGDVRVPRGVPRAGRARCAVPLGRRRAPGGLTDAVHDGHAGRHRAGATSRSRSADGSGRPCASAGRSPRTSACCRSTPLTPSSPLTSRRPTPARAGHASPADVMAAIGDRTGQLYRVRFHVAGPDPRLALREPATWPTTTSPC